MVFTSAAPRTGLTGAHFHIMEGGPIAIGAREALSGRRLLWDEKEVNAVAMHGLTVHLYSSSRGASAASELILTCCSVGVR